MRFCVRYFYGGAGEPDPEYMVPDGNRVEGREYVADDDLREHRFRIGHCSGVLALFIARASLMWGIAVDDSSVLHSLHVVVEAELDDLVVDCVDRPIELVCSCNGQMRLATEWPGPSPDEMGPDVQMTHFAAAQAENNN